MNDARNFRIASDDRVELVLARAVGERTGKARERAGLFRLFHVADLAFFDVGEDARERGAVYAEAREYLRSRAWVLYQSEKQVFRRYELVIERCGNARRGFKDTH